MASRNRSQRDPDEWFGLLERITLAGATARTLDLVDVATIAKAIDGAVAHDAPLERCLGLPPQWRSQWRPRPSACGLRVHALALRKGSHRAFAEELHSALSALSRQRAV